MSHFSIKIVLTAALQKRNLKQQDTIKITIKTQRKIKNSRLKITGKYKRDGKNKFLTVNVVNA